MKFRVAVLGPVADERRSLAFDHSRGKHEDGENEWQTLAVEQGSHGLEGVGCVDVRTVSSGFGMLCQVRRE